MTFIWAICFNYFMQMYTVLAISLNVLAQHPLNLLNFNVCCCFRTAYQFSRKWQHLFLCRWKFGTMNVWFGSIAFYWSGFFICMDIFVCTLYTSHSLQPSFFFFVFSFAIVRFFSHYISNVNSFKINLLAYKLLFDRFESKRIRNLTVKKRKQCG